MCIPTNTVGFCNHYAVMSYQIALLAWVVGSIPFALLIGLALRITGRNPTDIDRDTVIDIRDEATQKQVEASLLV